MPIFTVTVDDGNGNIKIVTVNTDGMVASVVSPTHASSTPEEHSNIVHMDGNGHNHGGGGKRSAPSFRLKKRRITRKLKKTR